MTLKITKDLEVNLGTSDGGMNYNTKSIEVSISFDEVNETTIVEGLTEKGSFSLSEIKSLYEDMTYVNDKSS